MDSTPPARLTAAEAAKLCRVKKDTIFQWVSRGHLDYARDAAGDIYIDEQGLKLFDQLDVARAEAKTRRHARRDLALLVRIGAHA